MSHLHIPDGVLPVWLWATAFVVALSLLVVSTRVLRGESPQRIAYRGALGALLLAAMAVEIPFGPLEYHLTLVGPLGVLLGAAAAFQVVFVANAVLALLGHGGLTVIGLNALVLGLGAALARPVYRLIARRPPLAMAAGTALSQAASGALWLAVMAVALRSRGWTFQPEAGGERVGVFAAVALPMWLVGIVVESTVAFGIARFLARVRPDLLPEPRGGRPAPLEHAP